MRKIDQDCRRKYVKLLQKGKEGTKKFKKVQTKLTDIDKRNTARIKEIVAQHGWPTFDKAGKAASKSAWILVQHADWQPLFQIKCLSLLKEAVDQGQADPSNYAYLYDRVQLALGKKQLYATQSTVNSQTQQAFFQALEDEVNVQKRREEMGIDQRIEDYAKALNFSYTIPTPEEAKERAQAFEDAYNTNIRKAKKAMTQEKYTDAAESYIQATYSDGWIQTEDFVETARAISLAKYKNSSWATFYLIKAAIRGWEGIDTFDTDKDFSYIKTANPEAWQNLLRIVEELNLQQATSQHTN